MPYGESKEKLGNRGPYTKGEKTFNTSSGVQRWGQKSPQTEWQGTVKGDGKSKSGKGG